MTAAVSVYIHWWRLYKVLAAKFLDSCNSNMYDKHKMEAWNKYLDESNEKKHIRLCFFLRITHRHLICVKTLYFPML